MVFTLLNIFVFISRYNDLRLQMYFFFVLSSVEDTQAEFLTILTLRFYNHRTFDLAKSI